MKKWWFWIIGIIVVLIILSVIVLYFQNSKPKINCNGLECSSGMKGFFDVEHNQCECGYKCTISSDCPSLACEVAPCPTKRDCKQGICYYSVP
jgi:hypothetical protein